MMRITAFLSLLLTANFVMAQNYNMDTSKSGVTWSGAKITGDSHSGTLQFQSGAIQFTDGIPSGGEFVVDMTSMVCTDLSEDYGKKLIGHLMSDDFFSVASHPTANLRITGAKAAENGAFDVDAQLTIKGITHPARFKLVSNNGNWKASLTFDRAKYDVRFGSGSFFENLGDKLILDEITLDTELVFGE
ncbi:MAG: YceI family protein [Flavobacteriaceae bacterium]